MPLAVCRFSGLRITPCGELFSINLGSFSRNLGRQTSLFSVNLTSSLLCAEDLKESRTVATEVTVGVYRKLSVFLSTLDETFDTGFQTRFTGYPVSTVPSVRAISVLSLSLAACGSTECLLHFNHFDWSRPDAVFRYAVASASWPTRPSPKGGML